VISLGAVVLIAQQPAAKPAGRPATKSAAKPASLDLTTLPAPVRATIENETKNATLKHVSKEVEKGRTQYEVETTVSGKSRDFLVDPSGKLLEVEEEIALDATPAPVQEALKKSGKVLKVETVFREGTTTFEASVQSANGRKMSVALDAQGKPVKG
jgi:uncharacterized membrane protein YkoI